MRSLCFSPDEVLLASIGTDNCFYVWDVNSGDHLVSLRTSDGAELYASMLFPDWYVFSSVYSLLCTNVSNFLRVLLLHLFDALSPPDHLNSCSVLESRWHIPEFSASFLYNDIGISQSSKDLSHELGSEICSICRRVWALFCAWDRYCPLFVMRALFVFCSPVCILLALFQFFFFFVFNLFI